MINAPLKDRLIGILVVPTILMMILVSYSLLIGWNLATMLLFWYLLVPALIIFMCWWFTGDRNPVWVNLSGLAVFYGTMLFMVYDHYQTDYFLIMFISLPVNVVLVTGIMSVAVPRSKTR